jgi:urease accessory protein
MNLLIWQLIDSGFPAGGFAHSGGLEAALHHGAIVDVAGVEVFARQALSQAGRSTLPFVTGGHTDPGAIAELDHQSDIFLTSAVANRASCAQGRALLVSTVRSFPHPDLDRLDGQIRRERLFAHYAPVFGAVSSALAIDLRDTQRAFLFMTVRGIASAAVRLGIAGGYEAQALQVALHADIDRVIDRYGRLPPSEAAQTAPLIDLRQSTHDRLYSRLFQS